MATDKILYINATVSNPSRTDALARYLLSFLHGEITEHKLTDLSLKYMDSAAISKRNADISKQDYSSYPLAKEFASADIIVIAAPHYDLSFPSLLKTYIENIYVIGLVTSYGADGRPVGLCHAKELYYVATSGGPLETRFGYDYIKTLALDYFGIKRCELIAAENLDIYGSDAEAILEATRDKIDHLMK